MTDLCIEILLVENQPHEVELTLHSLRSARPAAHVHVARDGVEALEFLLGRDGATPRQVARTGPRVILLDLRIPRVDGFQVIKRLKADPIARTIPVVVLSSSHEASDVAECYRLGANSYVVKPVDFREFSETVRTLGEYWLNLNRAQAPA